MDLALADGECNCLGCRLARVVDDSASDISAPELLDELAMIMGRMIGEAPEGLQPQLLARSFDQIAHAAGYDCVHGPLPPSVH